MNYKATPDELRMVMRISRLHRHNTARILDVVCAWRNMNGESMSAIGREIAVTGRRIGQRIARANRVALYWKSRGA